MGVCDSGDFGTLGLGLHWYGGLRGFEAMGQHLSRGRRSAEGTRCPLFPHLCGQPRQLAELPGTQRAHTAGPRAQKPVSLASQGWVSIVKGYMLPDRSFACSTARIAENASQSNVILLCFDRSGLAVAKYCGAGG